MRKLNIEKNGRPCIYSITNKINNKQYIGSATGHYRRKSQHIYMLRRGIHYNPHLQSSFDKYGESSFEFKVLEFVNDLIELEERELYYINKTGVTNPEIGYNIRPDCRTNLGLKWPEESKRRFSESKKGKRIPHMDYEAVRLLTMKKVIGRNKKTMEKLEFESIKSASEALKIDRTSISKALHKVIKSAGNYYWELAVKAA